MEMLLLILIILMFAVAFAFAGEIYLYVSLVFGSFIRDVQNYINKIRGK